MTSANPVESLSPLRRFLATLEEIAATPGWRVDSDPASPGKYRVTGPRGYKIFYTKDIKTDDHLQARLRRIHDMGWPPAGSERNGQIALDATEPPAEAASNDQGKAVPVVSLTKLLDNLANEAAILATDLRETAGAPSDRHGVPGSIWHGDPLSRVRHLWPDLSEADVRVLGQRMILHLDKTGVVVALHSPPGAWWVRADDADDAGQAADQVAATPGTPPAVAVEATSTPAETASTGRGGQVYDLQPDENGVYHCDKCPFADEGRQAVVMHLNKSGDEHPVDRDANGDVMAYQCPVPGCRSVRATTTSYATHLRDKNRLGHGRTGKMCHVPTCLKWFVDQDALNRHRDAPVDQGGHQESATQVTERPQRRPVTASDATHEYSPADALENAATAAVHRIRALELQASSLENALADKNRTITDLRAKLADVERERDELKRSQGEDAQLVEQMRALFGQK